MTSANTDDVDDPFIVHYAAKVTDPQEVLMRADFARAEQLRRTAWADHNEERRYLLLRQARETNERWSGREDDLGEAWCYLDHALHDWLSEPGYMRSFCDKAQGVHALADINWRSQQQAREMAGHGAWEPTMPSEAPPGMAPTTRRSQLQARDMTGHGRWPDTTTTSNREGAEPMNNTTHPEHDTESNESATEELSPMQRRGEDQARYIAEHGIARDASGLLTSHHVTRVEERAVGSAAPSPLADYQPGSALDHGTDRDGFQW
ncbi:hypothetical protein [Nocardia sp. CNY236]|uniref:hypothetical protein n=1 Tax=Nocardia sp. CNY236 TaxID=1169152 RepID=UPI0004153294|nr:hypothetical protein [Nocardia sp. CNY236]